MRKNSLIFAIVAFCSPAAFSAPPQVGSFPVPVMNGVNVTVQTNYDPVGLVYNYIYTISNPATNTGNIYNVKMDMTAPATYYSAATQKPLTIPFGAAGPLDFLSVYYVDSERTFPHGGSIVDFGEELPAGWMGNISADGYGSFAVTDSSYEIAPGQTAGPFTIYGPGLPTIKDMQISPFWMLDDDTQEPTPDEVDAASTIDSQLVVHVPVLGPSSHYVLAEDQWDSFKNDINTAIQLGWISDSTFGQAVVSELAAARTINDTQGPAYVQSQLQTLENTINGSTSAQRNAEAFALLSLNVQAMLAALPAPSSVPPAQQYVPVQSVIFLTATTLPVGGTVSFEGHVVDEANNNQPISGFRIGFDVEGVNPNGFFGTTDANGNFVVSYQGAAVGTDHIYLHLNAEQFSQEEAVTWQGGPDLIVPSFIPPYVVWSGNGPIHITEITQNQGNTPAGASTTAYYLSTSVPFDWSNAVRVGSRNVPALQPGELSKNGGIDLAMPAGLSAGKFTMMACADDLKVIAETDETNNCATNQLAIPLKNPSPPPICTSASPTVALLWPPNHQMVNIGIQGVTSPNNLQITIAITSITQDEPVNSTGDGNTAPDGAGVGTGTAQVRSERSGIAQDGRLYFIAFKASDTNGNSCTGIVTVGVPHDKGQSNMPIDNGSRYDSTATK